MRQSPVLIVEVVFTGLPDTFVPFLYSSLIFYILIIWLLLSLFEIPPSPCTHKRSHEYKAWKHTKRTQKHTTLIPHTQTKRKLTHAPRGPVFIKRIKTPWLQFAKSYLSLHFIHPERRHLQIQPCNVQYSLLCPCLGQCSEWDAFRQHKKPESTRRPHHKVAYQVGLLATVTRFCLRWPQISDIICNRS